MSLNYKVLQQLGEGSFGKAFLCEKDSDGSLCVIKQILIEGMNEQEKADVLNESNILAKLDHPNIIKFYDVFESKKPKHMINIVTEYADGGDLSEKIKERKNKNGNFTESEILDYFTQICLAIRHIHEKKIIHRDLKSGNIFLMKNGFVKLGDFGIAKNFQRTIDKAKTMVGTPYYLSPEMIESKPYDSKSDIWSLGVLLYEMMTFKMPFNANSLASLIIKITRGNYIPPPVIYTKDLRELVSKCLTLDPKNRPTIKEILGMPFIKFHIKSFLDEAQYNKEFSKTITKKYKEKEKTNIKPKEAKGINVEVFEPKVISGTSIADINIKKNSNNNSNKKIVDYFKQRNIKKEKEEKEKDKKRQEFKDFLKETKKSKKWGGIDQNQYNESGVMWGKNQENQRPILFKENNLKEEEDQSEVNNLNDLLESYDINKITEEQYDKARFLNNLDNVVNEEKGNNDDMNDIVNQGGENKQENNSDIDEECYSEFIKIELIRIKLEKSLGLKTFKDIYRYISHIVYDKDMKCSEDEIKDKIKDDFGNKGYNGKEIDSILKKFPEIYSLILKEKSIEQ